MTLALLLGLLGGLLLWGIAYYNRLVKYTALAREAWSGVDVQLKRRHDLIPNLVETVKGYAGHERKLLEEITALRSRSESTASVQGKGQVEQALQASIRSVFALAEAYPDLKANQNFLRLQQDLAAIEEDLSLARRYYNGTVRNLNILIESFPGLLLARLFAFKTAEFFALEDAQQRKTPAVAFE